MIDAEARGAFERDGYLVARGLLPSKLVDDAIDGVRKMLAARFPALSRDDSLHENLVAAARLDRKSLGVVYDGIRKLGSFWRLVGAPEVQTAAEQLLRSSALGVAFRSSGIRLDMPDEDRWRSDWHQEYPAQLVSPAGVVAWIPLVGVDQAMGPVRIARGSHREGLLSLVCGDPLNLSKNYTTAMHIPDAEAIAERYPEDAPSTLPGDVVFIDFLTLHASGYNRSPRTRIACQARYVDLCHPEAVARGWIGGMHEGHDFRDIHPDKVIPPRNMPP